MPKKKDDPISTEEANKAFVEDLKKYLNPFGYVIVNIREALDKDKGTKH